MGCPAEVKEEITAAGNRAVFGKKCLAMEIKDKLRVVLLNDSFPPMIDGVANVILNYAEILTELGMDVLVATPDYPGVRDEYPFEVLRYKSLDTTKLVGYRTGYPFDEEMLRRIEEFMPDVIHTHCPVVSAILARVLRKITGAPMILTYHTKFDIELSKYIKSDVVRDAARVLLIENIAAADDVWVVSRGAGENLVSMGFEGRYTVMENGVDFPRGGVSPEEAERIDALHDLPAGVPVYLFVGRMMWYKGVRLILDALKRIREEGNDFRMIFIGDGAEKEEMIRYGEEAGLSDRLIFTGAVSDRSLLRAYFTRADLFLFPSTFDTNGIVVREAAACGLASVLVRGSCAAEGIEDGESGLLAEEDAASVAGILSRYAHDREGMRKLGENAMNEIYVPWRVSVERALLRYREVLAMDSRGELHNSDSSRENYFSFIRDIYERNERFRELGVTLFERREELQKKIEEQLDRYL